MNRVTVLRIILDSSSFLTIIAFLSRVKIQYHSSFIIHHEKTGKRKNY